MNETTTHPKASELADELAPFIAAALEPKPAPLPEQDSRVDEAMAGRADIQAYALWRERTDEARRQLAERGPDILTALRTPPTATEEAVEAVNQLREEFQRWLDKGPDKQPHYENGMRPFSTGDLKAFAAALSTYPVTRADEKGDFQLGVDRWMDQCFGEPIKSDQLERADRFTEEALELAQTMPGFTKDRAHALVDYVFDRPQGDINQEVGGVMVTLAALCNTTGVRIDEAASTEPARVWTKVEQIRAKQAAKPTGSALPAALRTPAPDSREAVLEEAATIAGDEAEKANGYYAAELGGNEGMALNQARYRVARNIETAIRALKSTPSKTTADQVGGLGDGL